MPEFVFTGFDGVTGLERRGQLASDTKEKALLELRGRSIAVTSLVETTPSATAGDAQPERRHPDHGHGRWSFPLRRRMRRKTLTAFTRQLATLVNSGMPLHRALGVVARAEPDREFRETIQELARAIEAGGTLSDGLEEHPRTFDRLYRHMAKAGEAGGALGAVLERLAQSLERGDRIRGKVTAAMVYPLVVLTLAGGIMAALMLVVVPKFEMIFHGLLRGQSLPALTQALLSASSFMLRHLPSALAAGGAGVLLIRKLFATAWGGQWRDRVMLKLPVAGDLLHRTALVSFTRTLGSLLASGVPILQTLQIAREGMANRVMAEAVEEVHRRVREGASLAASLAETARFPHLVISMTEVGEETGDLSGMLLCVSDVYESEVDNAVAALISVVEPALIVGMALVVGFIVIALFLPIVGVIERLQ